MKCPRCDEEMIDANGFGIFVCNNCGDSADVSILELIDSYKEELRKTKHALWVARAKNAAAVKCYWMVLHAHHEDYVDKHLNNISEEYCCL